MKITNVLCIKCLLNFVLKCLLILLEIFYIFITSVRILYIFKMFTFPHPLAEPPHLAFSHNSVSSFDFSFLDSKKVKLIQLMFSMYS